eukprot:JP436568.1.p1 GENE.JP436568.1~~JP436568.1.p1  ORF type:complete len:203 (-),score=64.55 JP436568.1:166-774(-)
MGGGKCTCPDGQVYEVGDNNDHCGSLACEGGVSGPCVKYQVSPGAGYKVTCAQPAADDDELMDLSDESDDESVEDDDEIPGEDAELGVEDDLASSATSNLDEMRLTFPVRDTDSMVTEAKEESDEEDGGVQEDGPASSPTTNLDEMRMPFPVRDTDSMVTEAKEESDEEDGDGEEDSVGTDEGDEAQLQNEKVDEAFDEVLF